jgi:hypothetical protein
MEKSLVHKTKDRRLLQIVEEICDSVLFYYMASVDSNMEKRHVHKTKDKRLLQIVMKIRFWPANPGKELNI